MRIVFNLFMILIFITACASYDDSYRRIATVQSQDNIQYDADDVSSTLKAMRESLNQSAYSLELDRHIAILINYTNETTDFASFNLDQITTILIYLRTAQDQLSPLNSQDFNYLQKERASQLLHYFEQYLWELYIYQAKSRNKGIKIKEIDSELRVAFHNSITPKPHKETLKRKVENLNKQKQLLKVKDYRLRYSTLMKLDSWLEQHQDAPLKDRQRLSRSANRIVYSIQRQQKKKNGLPLAPVELFRLIDHYIEKYSH